jgi:DNA polymerase elongation subunit (family B)
MVSFKFYPVDVNYKVNNDRAVIYIYGKTSDGKQVCLTDNSFSPYFWVLPKKNIEDLKEKILKLKTDEFSVVDVKVVKKSYLGKEYDFLKVFTDLPKSVPKVREEIKDWDLVHDCFEYDILFARRYLIDRKIIPLNCYEVKADAVAQKSKVDVFELKSIEPSSSEISFEPKVLAFDIETYNPTMAISPDENPILMVSFYGHDFKKVVTWKKVKAEYVEFVDSESELIERFKEIVNDYKPDVLCGYFSDGFDLPYIKVRAQKYKIKIDLGLDYSEIVMGKGQQESCQIIGICHADVFKFVRSVLRTALKTDTYDLDSVAMELLGEKKVEVDVGNLAVDWDSNKNLEKYVAYNLQDSKLTYELFVKLFPNMVEMVKIVGLTLYDISRMGLSQLIEWYLLRLAPDYNIVSPNRPKYADVSERRQQTYVGGLVFEPKPGLYFNVVIFDFRSLYPTIIASHNISLDTLNCDCCESKDIPPEEKFGFCKKKKGFIPSIIENLIERRSRVKEIIKTKGETPLLYARQMSLKLLANSFYGYLGFFGARWYSIECARSVTSYGRYYIRKVISEAVKQGFNVIYSDTDSVFLTLDKKTKKDAMDFVNLQNESLPGVMELEYEGFYPSAIFVSAKQGDAGAKKRYAMLNEKGNIVIKGFETVRRNTSIIAKETQEEVLRIILSGEGDQKAINYVKNVVSDLNSHKVPVSKVVIETQITKEIHEYESISPHVAIAEKMRNKGMAVGPGSIIRYVVCKGEGKIRDKAKISSECSEDDYDPDYYINNQVIPSVEKILEVFGHKKDELVKKGDQNRLDKFF